MNANIFKCIFCILQETLVNFLGNHNTIVLFVKLVLIVNFNFYIFV